MSQPLHPDIPTTKRYLTKESATVEIYGRVGKLHCRLSNLSASGAFLEVVNAKSMPRQGDIVRMTVVLRQLNKIHTVDAEVVWCKGLGLGLSFIKRDQVTEKIAARVVQASSS